MDLVGFGQLSGESFEIIEPLGCGSSGTVYKARHLGLDRFVALKVLKQTDAVSLARFHREAQILAQLKHKNICQCFQFGVEKGIPFMALELIEAPTLRNIMTGKQLDWRQSSEIGIQVCAGLQAAHEQGVIHRDIKPDNIMLMPDGTAKILDFGLSGFDSEGAQKLTQAHVTLGTPPYMSPEQCTAGHLDQRSDIYALGCSLFECVAGIPPFSGDTIASVMLKQESQLPPPLEDYASVPPGYEFIIRKALSKDPNLRYQSAKDFGLALSDLLDDPDAPVPILKPVSDLSWRQLFGYAIPSAAAVMLICGFALVFRPASKMPEPETEESRSGVVKGSKRNLAKVSSLYAEDGGHGKERARDLLKETILAEEVQAHPDSGLLYDAYLGSVTVLDPPAAEPYLRKAVAMGRREGASKAMKALWALCLTLARQGKDPEALLHELFLLATKAGNRSYAGRADGELCGQYMKQGRLKEAESRGISACNYLVDSIDASDGNMYGQTIARLITLHTETARKVTEQHLSMLSDAQAQWVMLFLIDHAIVAEESATYLQCLDGLGKIHQKTGLSPDTALRQRLLGVAGILNSKNLALQHKIILSLAKIIPRDEMMWMEMSEALYLLAHQDVAAAEQVVEKCQQRFQQKKDWPHCYQAYLDRLFGALSNDKSKLQALLPRYDANLPRLRKACGSESTEYAMALWIRARLNRDLNNMDAAWHDFDALEAIVSASKKPMGLLELDYIRKYKALADTGRH